MSNLKNLIGDVVASPLGQVIAQIGQGVADAQMALDEGSLAKVLEIYSEGDDEKLALLREIGYRPTFYTLPETTGEVRVALRLGNLAQGKSPTPSPSPSVWATPARAGLNTLPSKMYAMPVDAGYANAYGYQADIAAKLTFKIVPVPPPEGADELRLIPDLSGRTMSEARTALEALGLGAIFIDADGLSNATLTETYVVKAQTPSAAEVARLEDDVTLTIGPAV